MLSQLSSEELVQLGVEHSICYELRAGTKVKPRHTSVAQLGLARGVLRKPCHISHNDLGDFVRRLAHLPLLADVCCHAGQALSCCCAISSMQALRKAV